MHESDMPSDLHAAFHRHGTETSMPATSIVPETVHLTVRLRLLPETQAKAQQLAGTAGACRWVWNRFLARQQFRWRCWQDYRIGPRPSVSFFSLGKEFTALRQSPEYSWLQEYSYAAVRYTLKQLSDAYRKFWSGQGGHPQFKARHRTVDGFTIADQVALSATHLRVPRIGWLRVKGHNRYADCQPVQARIRKEGTATQPRWYAYVVCAVPADQACQGADRGTVGLDRNVGQVTDSDGVMHRMTDTSRLEAKIKRKQRHLARKCKGSCRRRRIAGQLQKLHRKCRRIRDNDTHRISRRLADKAHAVVIEDLPVQGMTRSARGTVDSPGTNVQAKAGLNRAIRDSGWSQLERKLIYKCGQVVRVPAAYTSQTCSVCACVDRRNRPTQARFHCIRCRAQFHADHNAALNILERHRLSVAHGTGASARRGAWPSGPPTTREQDISESVYLGI